MTDISPDIVARAQAGDAGARESVLSGLSIRFTGAIRHRLSCAMDRDDAHQDAQVILLDLIDDYDPTQGVPLEAFVATMWLPRAVDTIRRHLPGAVVSVDDWDEDYPTYVASLDTPEAAYLDMSEHGSNRALLDGILSDVEPADRAALLAWASSSEWRASDGGREYRSVGSAVAEAYLQFGVTVTPRQATWRISSLLRAIRSQNLVAVA